MPNKKKSNIPPPAVSMPWPPPFATGSWKLTNVDSGVEIESPEEVTTKYDFEEYKSTIPESPIEAIPDSPAADTMEVESFPTTGIEDTTEDEFVDANKDVITSSPEEVKMDQDYSEDNVIDNSIIGEDEMVPDESSSKGKNKEDKYLIFPCIQCPKGIQVRYPYSGYKEINKELNTNSFCIIAYTTCKECLMLRQSTQFIEDTAMERKDAVENACMYIDTFIGSAIYDYAVAVSDSAPTILSRDGFIRYIPVTKINGICNSKCKASTIDIKNGTAKNYLEFGFIP